jgi:hypothetical protein
VCLRHVPPGEKDEARIAAGKGRRGEPRCCGTCGAAEISDEIEAARARRPVSTMSLAETSVTAL